MSNSFIAFALGAQMLSGDLQRGPPTLHRSFAGLSHKALIGANFPVDVIQNYSKRLRSSPGPILYIHRRASAQQEIRLAQFLPRYLRASDGAVCLLRPGGQQTVMAPVPEVPTHSQTPKGHLINNYLYRARPAIMCSQFHSLQYLHRSASRAYMNKTCLHDGRRPGRRRHAQSVVGWWSVQ